MSVNSRVLLPLCVDMNGTYQVALPGDVLMASGSIVGGGAPTASAGTALGTTGTPSVVVTGDNSAGKIVITTGLLSLFTGQAAVISFANGLVFPNGCFPQVGAGDSNAAAVISNVYAIPRITVGWELWLRWMGIVVAFGVGNRDNIHV